MSCSVTALWASTENLWIADFRGIFFYLYRRRECVRIQLITHTCVTYIQHKRMQYIEGCEYQCVCRSRSVCICMFGVHRWKTNAWSISHIPFVLSKSFMNMFYSHIGTFDMLCKCVAKCITQIHTYIIDSSLKDLTLFCFCLIALELQ